MRSFVIHRKFVVGVGLFDVFFDRCVFLNVFHVVGVLLVFLSVLMLVCVVDFDILRGFVVGLLYMRFNVFLVKLFGIFGLVCLVSGVLMVRMLSSEPNCREIFMITCTF